MIVNRLVWTAFHLYYIYLTQYIYPEVAFSVGSAATSATDVNMVAGAILTVVIGTGVTIVTGNTTNLILLGSGGSMTDAGAVDALILPPDLMLVGTVAIALTDGIGIAVVNPVIQVRAILAIGSLGPAISHVIVTVTTFAFANAEVVTGLPILAGTSLAGLGVAAGVGVTDGVVAVVAITVID
jgi:hypothetical protein